MRRLGVSKRHSMIANLVQWLLFYLLAMYGQFPLLVLCVSGSAHIAVETVHTNYHRSSPQEARGVCVDLPSINGAHKDYPVIPFPSLPVQGQITSLLLSAPGLSMAQSLPPGTVDRRFPGAIAPDLSLGSLRTVVLQI